MAKASSNSVSATARALWLSDLARAIDEAQRLAWHLGVVEGRSQALDLYVRLEIARAEVDALRVRSGTSPAPEAARLARSAPMGDSPEASEGQVR